MPLEDTNTTISFRLPQAQHDEIVRLAEASGTTKHQLARTLIVRALESGDGEATGLDLAGLDEALQLIHFSLDDIRLALGRGIGALLQDVAPKRDREEIRRWVFDKIITPTSRSDTEGGDDK